MIPRSFIGRCLAIIWLLACIALLVSAFKQQHIHDMPEAVIPLLVALSFPIGYFVVIVAGLAWAGASATLHLTYHPFRDLIPIWVPVVVLGYLQWFVLVPWLFRKLRKPSQAPNP
jgi:hypothetical protein